MTILIVDGMNFLHRARAGFQLGDYFVVFNAFRNLRALVELHAPTRVYFVLEGHPKQRLETLPSYKANRDILVPSDGSPIDEKTSKKLAEMQSFYRQVNLFTDLLQKHFPVSVVRHPDHECDDTIFNIINRNSRSADFVVASNDTDFTQLLNDFPNVKVYNPMTKEYVVEPPFDYVTWKALRGDGSDNIPGIKGISDARAEELVCDPEKLGLLFEDKGVADQFAMNFGLIKFIEWSETEAMLMTSSAPERNWDVVASSFTTWEFKSILKENSWSKFIGTFDCLWG